MDSNWLRATMRMRMVVREVAASIVKPGTVSSSAQPLRISVQMPRSDASLTPAAIGMILVTLAMLACGQVLFKLVSAQLSFSRPASFLSGTLLVALAMYGAATLLWLAVLARVPLSVAFPFYGLTFLLVPTFAWWLLHEPIRPQTWLGGAVILVGVVISSWGNRA
ncbi:MAG: EamA family transporter [Stenotrophomonas sp.]|uniref:EamA family transporter n=1 Tax=Stenotrophomonas sp. TaxID=69392 RepID=UPI003D6D2CE4